MLDLSLHPRMPIQSVGVSMPLLRPFLIATLIAAPLSQAAEPRSSGSSYFPPSDAAGGWRTATNSIQARELAGLDASRLDQAWEFTQRCTQNGGLLVVRKGYLVFEKYFGRASRNANPDMASTGKRSEERRV